MIENIFSVIIWISLLIITVMVMVGLHLSLWAAIMNGFVGGIVLLGAVAALLDSLLILSIMEIVND